MLEKGGGCTWVKPGRFGSFFVLCFLALRGHCLQMLFLPGFGTHANTQNLPHFRAFTASIQERSPPNAYFSWQTLNCQIVPVLPFYRGGVEFRGVAVTTETFCRISIEGAWCSPCAPAKARRWIFCLRFWQGNIAGNLAGIVRDFWGYGKISPKFSCIKFFQIRDVPTQIPGHPGHSLSKTTERGHLQKKTLSGISRRLGPWCPTNILPKNFIFRLFYVPDFRTHNIKAHKWKNLSCQLHSAGVPP